MQNLCQSFFTGKNKTLQKVETKENSNIAVLSYSDCCNLIIIPRSLKRNSSTRTIGSLKKNVQQVPTLTKKTVTGMTTFTEKRKRYDSIADTMEGLYSIQR